MFLVGSPVSGRVGIRFYKLNPLHMIERRVEPDLREGLGKHGKASLRPIIMGSENRKLNRISLDSTDTREQCCV